MTRNSEWRIWVGTRGRPLIASFLRRERDWVLSEFKAGRSPILIATDVASRGIGMHFLLLSISVQCLGGRVCWRLR